MARQPFAMEGQSAEMDEQKLVTWTRPYYVELFEDIFDVGEPPHKKLVETSRTWADIPGAGIKVDVTYEGYMGEDAASEEPTYEWDSSFKEETLIAHPLWLEIAEFYEGKYDQEEKKITFSEQLDTSGSGLGSDEVSKKNPMLGLETFLSLGIVFRMNYLVEELPASLFQGIGRIEDSLPGKFPTPVGRDWMVMPPKISQTGNVYKISEERLLSPPGKWPPKVYGLIQI